MSEIIWNGAISDNEFLKLIKLLNDKVNIQQKQIEACKIAIDGVIDMNKKMCAVLQELGGNVYE